MIKRSKNWNSPTNYKLRLQTNGLINFEREPGAILNEKLDENRCLRLSFWYSPGDRFLSVWFNPIMRHLICLPNHRFETEFLTIILNWAHRLRKIKRTSEDAKGLQTIMLLLIIKDFFWRIKFLIIFELQLKAVFSVLYSRVKLTAH